MEVMLGAGAGAAGLGHHDVEDASLPGAHKLQLGGPHHDGPLAGRGGEGLLVQDRIEDP
jgi:hypothetical protein